MRCETCNGTGYYIEHGLSAGQSSVSDAENWPVEHELECPDCKGSGEYRECRCCGNRAEAGTDTCQDCAAEEYAHDWSYGEGL
jgi:hypothetical protein